MQEDDDEDDAEAGPHPVIHVGERGQVSGGTGGDKVGLHGGEEGGGGYAKEFGDEVQWRLPRVEAGVEGEDFGDELEDEEDDEEDVEGVPDGGEGYGELAEVELAGAEDKEGVAGDLEDVGDPEAVEDEVGDAAGARFALEWGFEGGEFGGVPGGFEGIGVFAVEDVLGDGEDDGEPGDEDQEPRDDLGEASRDAGDEFGEGVDEEQVRCLEEEADDEDDGNGSAQRHEVVGEDGWADEVLLGEIAGGDEDGAAVLLEEVGYFGIGEGAVELFGAVVELGLEVGAELGEDVFAGGGREVVADGLEVAVEEVGGVVG